MKQAIIVFLILLTFSTQISANTGEIEQAAKFFMAKNYAAAYPLLEKLETANSTETKVYLYKGLIERSRQQLSKAVKTFFKGLALNSADIPLLLELAVTYSWNNQLEKAIGTYDKILVIDAENAPALSGKARVSAWLKRYDEAKRIYGELLKTDNPKLQNEALNGLAFISRMDLKVKKAKEFYREVLEKDAANTEAREGLTAVEGDTRNEIVIDYAATGSLKNQASDISFSFSRQQTRKTGFSFGMHYHAADQFLESVIYHPTAISAKPTKTFVVGIKHEFSNRLKMATNFVVRNSQKQTARFWSFEGNYKLNAKFSVSFGQNILLARHTKTLEIMGFGGLNWKLNGKNNFSIQYFNAGKLMPQRTNAVILSWNNKPLRKITFGIGFGIGKTPTTTFKTAYGDVNWSVRRNIDLSIRYTMFQEKFKQNGVVSSLRYRF